MSQAQLEKKVTDYLRNSEALENWRPLTASQLQTEMERMAQHTKQPTMLRELFEALGNDPFVIAECLARPDALGAFGNKFQCARPKIPWRTEVAGGAFESQRGIPASEWHGSGGR
jgi:hypothetical protein